jgi:carbonic anhydrase
MVQLKIRDIIVCGHSHCGAMNGLLNPQALGKMPRTNEWLRFARDILPELPPKETVPAEELLDIAIERNVLLQIAHMKTHPPVALALAEGTLRVHAWVYHFETGVVVAHDPNKGRFVPLAEAAHQQFVKSVPASTDKLGEWDGTI